LALFERIGRRLVLTATGAGLLDHARTMASAADALALAAEGRAQDISGRVSISATDAFAAYVLPEIIEHIRATLPQVTIAIVATDSISDLRRREADIAIRHVRPTEPELIARRVMEMQARLYATKAWIDRNGRPSSPADLREAELLGFEPIEQFVGHLAKAGLDVRVQQVRITSENAVVLWEMLRRGLGVGVVLSEVADRMAGIVRLLPEMPAIPVPVWLVAHRELHSSRRIRLVYDAIDAGLQRFAAAGADKPRARKARVRESR
ncbi:MAG TPA: LysR substrate-binding domain-containing protein, partial [Hyphomicrobiaceae bacterium]|nr:LysR substrate-binding domain-containing protein [Hyphomicrobiaceae bacterium]